MARYHWLQVQAAEVDLQHRKDYLFARRVARAWQVLIVLVLLAAVLIAWTYAPYEQWWAAVATSG